MRRYQGAAVSAYRPPDVAELSPRERTEAQATLQAAEASAREVWRSYLGPRADLGAWRVADGDDGVAALAWQCGTWQGRVHCDAELQRGIVAAATGFDEISEARDEPLGNAATAVLRVVLAVARRSLLGAFGLPAREAVRWRETAKAEPGVIVRGTASAAGVPGEIEWYLPLAAVRRPRTSPTGEARASLREAVGAVAVTVQATVAGPQLTTGELAHLAPGDIVLLGGQSLERVNLIVSGRPVARAQPGLRSEKLALRITEMPLTNEVPNGDGHR